MPLTRQGPVFLSRWELMESLSKAQRRRLKAQTLI